MDEQDIAVGLLDLFTHVEQVLSPLFDHFVHLPIVVDDDGVVHLFEGW